MENKLRWRFSGALCSVYYSKNCVSLLYYDAENSEQGFYAISKDNGTIWEKTNVAFWHAMLSSQWPSVTSIYHQEVGNGCTMIVVNESFGTGAIGEATGIYSLADGEVTLLTSLSSEPRVSMQGINYVRACYFENDKHGYIAYCHQTIDQPVCFETTDGGYSWKCMDIEIELEDNAYGEICAFQETEQGVEAVVWISHMQGNLQVQKILLSDFSHNR